MNREKKWNTRSTASRQEQRDGKQAIEDERDEGFNGNWSNEASAMALMQCAVVVVSARLMVEGELRDAPSAHCAASLASHQGLLHLHRSVSVAEPWTGHPPVIHPPSTRHPPSSLWVGLFLVGRFQHQLALPRL